MVVRIFWATFIFEPESCYSIFGQKYIMDHHCDFPWTDRDGKRSISTTAFQQLSSEDW